MYKILTSFFILLIFLFSLQITYATPFKSEIVIQQLQYNKTTKNYNKISVEYNNKKNIISYITKKDTIIDKPIIFSESNNNFIFIAINNHLGTGLYKTDALIFNTDTLQLIPIKKDYNFIKQNFSSQISYTNKIISLSTTNQTITLQNNSRLNNIFTAYQKNPSLFYNYNTFIFPLNIQYRYQYMPQSGNNIICSHGLEFPNNWLIGNIIVLYRYNHIKNCFEPDKNSTIKLDIFSEYQ